MQAATRLHRTARGRFGIQPEGLCVKNCVMHMEFLGACCDFCLQIPELCLTFSTKNVKYFKNEVFKKQTRKMLLMISFKHHKTPTN